MQRRHLPLLLIALAAPSAAFASDQQVWATQAATVKLGGPWFVSEELVERFSDHRHGLYEIESNTLLGYRFNKVVSVAGGYTHDPQYAGGTFTIMEQRAREQVSFDGFAKLGTGKLSGRARFEERWRNGISGTGWRVRPFIKYSVPIAGKVALNLSAEPFINLNTTRFQAKPGLDRVRSLVTFSVPLSKHLSGEAGYMNQHGFVSRGPDTSDHIAYFALSLNI